MPKLNKNLIRSIVQDLNSLEEACNELHQCVPPSDRISWRYPSQMCHNIHICYILNQYRGSAYECYLLVLELLYDRFQYFLHLIISYLDMIPFLSQEVDLPRNVVSPEYLSTGALLNMLWTRIQLLQRCILESVVRNAKCEDGRGSKTVSLSLGAVLSKKISAPICHQLDSFSRSTQTEDCALIKCESCCVSEDLVQLIVNEIQTYCTEYNIQSLLLHERENMKEEILHITQWKAMTKWSEAAKKDLKQIFQALNKQIHHIRELGNSLGFQEKKVKEQFANKNQEISNLENYVCTLQSQLQAEKLHVDHLAQEKQKQDSEIKKLTGSMKKLEMELRKTENSLNEESHKKCIMESALKNITHEIGLHVSSCEEYGHVLEHIKTLKSEKNDFKNKLIMTEKKLQEKEDVYKTEVGKWDVIFKKEKENQCVLSCELQKMNEYYSQCQELKVQNEHLQLHLHEAEQKLASSLKNAENIEKELQQRKINEKLLLEYPDLNTPVEIKVHGNPEQDMENQMEANKIRIKLLTEQNIKLEETLHKLRKITKLQWGI